MRARVGCTVATLAVVLVPVFAYGQVIPPSEQPGRERERFVDPAPPAARPGGPAVILPSTEPPSEAAQIHLTIRDICVRGSTVYSKEQLAPLYADLIGHDISLQAIYDLAKKITAKYGADGYSLSRAIVPPQEFSPKGAVPCLQVVEGYVERVEWPASLSRFRDFFTDYAAKITAERPVSVHTIERYMLLAGDLPGLKFSASLKPSPTQQGASVLVVEVKEKKVDALGRFDNRGSEARGPVQVMASGTLNNILGAHESFNLTWAATQQWKELEYFAAGYRQVLTAEGLWVFVNASHGYGKPGTAQLETLEYKTKSTILETGLASPIIRTREKNLTLTGLFFASNSDSNSVLGFLDQNDRLRGVRGKLDADMADAWLGINQFNLTLSRGFHGLGSTDNGNPRASRAAGQVDFAKLEGSASRLQPLPQRFSLFGSVYGQYAFDSLLSPEQCGYGGRFYGRAYDPSELLGDHCFTAIGEVRYDLPSVHAQISQFQLYGFADYGKVWTRVSPDPSIPASVDAASAGAGVRVSWLNYVNADITVAKAIDGPRDDTRVFFAVTGRY